jgi:uncharacterized protein YbjT (DUF2867 family)
MNILLTGATGYIGKRLLPYLIESGHRVICVVRDPERFHPAPSLKSSLEVVRVDFLNKDSLANIPANIDAAYYLIHSMSSSKAYEQLEKQAAINFRERMSEIKVKQVIYLSGIINEDQLSKHLRSRKRVEETLASGQFHLTTLRAGIIIGSGSASFEIIRDLVEKLPIMVAPKWLNTYCQPIGIREVLTFLKRALLDERLYSKNFDIGGPDILSYKQMLLQFAEFRGLKRWILTIPVMTPRLSSYWLYFVTSTSYKLASSLVNSMKVEVVCRNTEINQILDVETAGYRQSLERAFARIASNQIISSWKDSQVSGVKKINISEFINVPQFGCFKDRRTRPIKSKVKTIENIWRLGGDSGWYYATFLWQIRGFLDKVFGGVGLRRGRSHPTELAAGDALDFWRVLYANKEEGRLLLFAEMKVPGEAWLEFKIERGHLRQTATFRPHGLMGRMYWYAVLPFHGFVFSGLINKLTQLE